MIFSFVVVEVDFPIIYETTTEKYIRLSHSGIVYEQQSDPMIIANSNRQ